MAECLLSLNAGSSSIKFSIFHCNGSAPSADGLPVAETLPVALRGQIDGLYTSPRCRITNSSGELLEGLEELRIDQGHQAAIGFLLPFIFERILEDHRLVAVGHRIVHGGPSFVRPTRIAEAVVLELEQLNPLAPLHQPHNLSAIAAVTALMPEVPQVACFDTAFHHTLPFEARSYAIPRTLMEQGVRRYGFHGLSFESIMVQLSALDPAAVKGRTIVAHLGNGVSLCGILGGQSQVTSMGMTPLDGLPMGTRCGNLDPGILLYLLDQHRYSSSALSQMLYHQSGLFGLSGISSDMRDLISSDDPRAIQTIDYFVYRVCREIGSVVAALSGVDALVFTGGIGENSTIIRQRICQQSAWLGLEIDSQANESGKQLISTPSSSLRVWIIPTNEELTIAQQTLKVLAEN